MSAFVPDRTSWRTVLRLAWRDLRGGLSGFVVFIACLALGVMAIAGVGSLSRSLADGLAAQGSKILGGDASFSLIQRQAVPEERAVLAARGRVSEVATLRAMARASGPGTLVELKVPDEGYPLVGGIDLRPPGPLAAALAARDGAFGAAVDPVLLARLHLEIGDRIDIGGARLAIRATVAREPDGLAGGLGFGPRVFVSREALDATGLVQPGSLIRWTYRLMLRDGSDAGLARLKEDARALADAGFEIRTRDDPSPQIARSVGRFTQFLTIVGLTALIVGGVGVANAVAAYVARKREVIATLKSLGASGRAVVGLFLVEVLLLACVGTAIGLVLGAAIPFAAAFFLAGISPLPIEPGIYPAELLGAAGYGLLTALAFSLWPLAQARAVPASLLYRARIEPVRRWPPKPFIAATVLCAAALVALSVLTAHDERIAWIFVAAAGAAFVGLRLVASAIMAAARALPRPRSTELRLAVNNLHRAGALTPSVVLSLGLGLTLLVALSLTDSAVRAQFTQALPLNAPSFFLLDLPAAEAPRLESALRAAAPDAAIERVPMLRGSIVRVNGTPAAEAKVGDDARFALQGDRGVTFSAALPDDSTIVAGRWWKPDHADGNLVSFEDKLAAGLGLTVGDEITVNVLGRSITATVANLRRVEWKTLGINFFMVFSPNTFAGAPHMDLATVTFPGGDVQAAENRVLERLSVDFPAVTAVRVRQALTDVSALFEQLALGIRAASGVTVLASILVLAGALAAGHQQRIYDAVVLKTLGATRARLLAAYALEYGLVGLVTAVFGLVAGSLAAWWITESVMDIAFSFDWSAPAVAVAAPVLTVVLGLAGTFRILNEPPARSLRAL